MTFYMSKKFAIYMYTYTHIFIMYPHNMCIQLACSLLYVLEEKREKNNLNSVGNNPSWLLPSKSHQQHLTELHSLLATHFSCSLLNNLLLGSPPSLLDTSFQSFSGFSSSSLTVDFPKYVTHTYYPTLQGGLNKMQQSFIGS